jgi:hypothetical protein
MTLLIMAVVEGAPPTDLWVGRSAGYGISGRSSKQFPIIAISISGISGVNPSYMAIWVDVFTRSSDPQDSFR